MAVGLKLKDVKRFGTKVQKGVRNVARKIEKGASVVENLAPIAGIVAGPEAAAGLKSLAGSVKGVAKGAEAATEIGTAKGIQGFKALQQPVLGARELAQAARGAISNPAQANVMIGDTLAKRFPSMKQNIQRTDAVEM